MLDEKWTGTKNDRREMKTLKLEQVLKVSVLYFLLALLTTVAAQFR
jgi:hypothetical protein